MFKLQRLEITGFKSFADYTEVVFTGSGITAVVGPNGCGKCVSGNTLITLSNGEEIEIRQLVEDALQGAFFKEQFDDGFSTHDNPQNIEILSLNPVTLKLEKRKVSAFIKRETTDKLLRVRTRAGREITATPYHPLFTLKEGKLHAVRADELKAGLRIATPRILPTEKHEIELSSKDYFSKFDLADRIFIPFTDSLSNWLIKNKRKFGSLSNWAEQAEVLPQTLNNLRSKQSINIAEINKLSTIGETPLRFSNQIKSHQNGFLNLPKIFSPKLAKFLGLLIAEGRNTYSSQVWFVNSDDKVNKECAKLSKELFNVQTSQKDYKKGTTDNLIFSQSLCKTLEKVFSFPINSTSFEKEVPSQLFQADSDTKWAFLSGLFEGDAYVCSRPQKSNGKLLNYIEYTTASKKLANQVVSLLLQLGVFAYLRPKQKYASNTIEKTVRQYFSVLVYGSKQLINVAQNLQFVGEKQKALEKLKNIEISDNPNRDLVPTATDLVREAVKLAKVKIKPNRKEFPKIAAYTGKICEASRNGLNEVVEQIKSLSEDSKTAENVLENLSTLANSDVYWDEIVSIEEIEPTDKWVYDLSIDETHNFVAGNMIVHNSNVSESIAWVLGEQRAKALRGAEMKDVVFQGTSKRKPSGMAEVVLHLVRDESPYHEDELGDIDEALGEIDDHAVSAEEFEVSLNPTPELTNGFHSENVENEEIAVAEVGAIETTQAKLKTKRHWRKSRVALDFAPGESISVTRRLYLSGESEYLLNGRTCRLRDIQDLFSGTGLSGAHYAIIEQGRIGQILSAKPSDRRSLIEEAAGISKFRTRQRAAEARLESAKGNLRRISDIVEEIDKQANSLRRQASKTRRYKVLREELRELLKQVFAAEGSFLTELVNKLEDKLEEAVTLERKLFSEVATKDESFREATHKAREAEEILTELRSQHAENALQRDRNSRELVYKQEQLTNLQNRSLLLKGEIDSLEQRLKLLKAEAERLQREEKIQRDEAEKEEAVLREAEKTYQSKLNELREIETEIEKYRGELLTHTAAVERFAEIERQLENTSERLHERLEGLKREGERAEDSHAEHLTQNESLEKSIAQIREKVKKLQGERSQLQEEKNEIKQNLQLDEKSLAKIREEFSRTRHRLETLRELDEKRAVYAPNVQKIFAEQNKIGVKLLGTLADKFTVEQSAEKAVENLFGAYLQTILVETAAEAQKVAKYVRENNVGRISILVFNAKTQSGKGAKSKNQIANSLGISDDLASLLQEVFPREMSAQIVDNADDTKAESFVTTDGDLV
ncbi:MAG TPA: LAGLIDADG family homing endonuclease, partial [Pyrinomonadaceae bacterium]|nr:LAGLIDADG family homing endonuclease [Pyrinomonadaceae bacterium]